MTSLSTVCVANFDIKFVHNLDIIKKTNVWSQNLLMNVMKTNKHSNVTTFVCALVLTIAS